MQSGNSTDNKFTFLINGQALSFDPDIDIKRFIIQPNSIHMQVLLSSELDPAKIEISLGDDIGFKGFLIRLEKIENSSAYGICQEDIDLLCGMRLIGRVAVNIFYADLPLAGYSTFVYFLPRKEIEDYVKAMRNDFQEDIAGLLDCYGLTREEFMLEPSDDERWEPSSLHVQLLQRLYKDTRPFFRSKNDELDSALIAGGNTSWVPLQNERQIQSKQLHDAYLAGQPFYCASVGAIQMLPAKVPVRHNEVSYNTYPNRLILSVLYKIHKDVTAVHNSYCAEQESLLNDYGGIRGRSFFAFINYKREKLKQATLLCTEILLETRRSICRLIDLGVKKGDGKNPPNRLILKQTYQMILLGYRRFRSHIELAQRGVHPWALIHSMQTRGVNYLYEIWIAKYILKLFTDTLKFTYVGKISAESLTISLLAGKPIELKSPHEGQYIKFYYGRKFPRFDNPLCSENIGVMPRVLKGEKRRIAKDNPDICIEFYDSYDEAPRILIFDPTFSSSPVIHKEKSYYKHLIWYRKDSNTPKSAWRRAVVESMAVHPYQSLRDELPLEGELTITPGVDRTITDESLIDLLRLYRLIE